MSTKELEKIVRSLSIEVTQLRSFVIGFAGKDKEGNYRTDFVKELDKAKSEKSKYEYTGKGYLLKLLKNQQ